MALSYQIRDKVKVSLNKVILSEYHGAQSNYMMMPDMILRMTVYAIHIQTTISRRIKFRLTSNLSCHYALHGHKYFDGPILLRQWPLCTGVVQQNHSIINYEHIGGFRITFISTTSFSFIGLTHFTYQSVEITPTLIQLTQQNTLVTINIDTSIRFGHLYYKVWQIKCDRFVKIERHHYPPNQNPFTGDYNSCLNAGLQINENSLEPRVSSSYGPYCMVNYGIPFVAQLRDWYMPKGNHTIVAYAYPEYLTFNLTFDLIRNECEGVTNACTR